jgi:hypothetical protein
MDVLGKRGAQGGFITWLLVMVCLVSSIATERISHNGQVFSWIVSDCLLKCAENPRSSSQCCQLKNEPSLVVGTNIGTGAIVYTSNYQRFKKQCFRCGLNSPTRISCYQFFVSHPQQFWDIKCVIGKQSLPRKTFDFFRLSDAVAHLFLSGNSIVVLQSVNVEKLGYRPYACRHRVPGIFQVEFDLSADIIRPSTAMEIERVQWRSVDRNPRPFRQFKLAACSVGAIFGCIRGVLSCYRLNLCPVDITNQIKECGNFKNEPSPFAARIVVAIGSALIAFGWGLFRKGRGLWRAVGAALLIAGVLILDHGLSMQDTIHQRAYDAGEFSSDTRRTCGNRNADSRLRTVAL